VLLDLNMPGAYGFSGLVLLRGQYPQIPVVMVSAQEEADVVVRSKEFGASGFIPKSSSMEEIQKAVRAVLEGDVSWPPQAFEEINVSDEAKAARDGLASLTPQQFRVLTMVCEGLLNKQIAYELSVSEATIKAHVTAIFRKLGCEREPRRRCSCNNLSQFRSIKLLSIHAFLTSRDLVFPLLWFSCLHLCRLSRVKPVSNVSSTQGAIPWMACAQPSPVRRRSVSWCC